MLYPICKFIRFANRTSDLQISAPNLCEFKNVDNTFKNVENEFINDLKMFGTHYKVI